MLGRRGKGDTLEAFDLVNLNTAIGVQNGKPGVLTDYVMVPTAEIIGQRATFPVDGRTDDYATVASDIYDRREKSSGPSKVFRKRHVVQQHILR